MIYLNFFMSRVPFPPIFRFTPRYYSQYINGLSELGYLSLGGAEVAFLTCNQEVPGSIPGSGKLLMYWLCFYYTLHLILPFDYIYNWVSENSFSDMQLPNIAFYKKMRQKSKKVLRTFFWERLSDQFAVSFIKIGQKL